MEIQNLEVKIKYLLQNLHRNNLFHFWTGQQIVQMTNIIGNFYFSSNRFCFEIDSETYMIDLTSEGVWTDLGLTPHFSVFVSISRLSIVISWVKKLVYVLNFVKLSYSKRQSAILIFISKAILESYFSLLQSDVKAMSTYQMEYT